MESTRHFVDLLFLGRFSQENLVKRVLICQNHPLFYPRAANEMNQLTICLGCVLSQYLYGTLSSGNSIWWNWGSISLRHDVELGLGCFETWGRLIGEWYQLLLIGLCRRETIEFSKLERQPVEEAYELSNCCSEVTGTSDGAARGKLENARIRGVLPDHFSHIFRTFITNSKQIILGFQQFARRCRFL